MKKRGNKILIVLLILLFFTLMYYVADLAQYLRSTFPS